MPVALVLENNFFEAGRMSTRWAEIVKVLASMGIPTTVCGRFLLWGACGDKECTLAHDDHKLTMAQVSQVKDILMESSKRILEKKDHS